MSKKILVIERKKILVIEDNQKHSFLFEDLLTGEGYEVEIAKNGVEVQQKMEGGGTEYNLLLVDIAIPQFKEEEVLKFIKTNKKRVLVVSAYADIEKVKKLLPENRRIKKPFDINLFRDRVKEILG